MIHRFIWSSLRFLGVVGVVFGLVTAHDAAAQEVRFDGVTLTVGTFGGSWRDRIHEYIGSKVEALGGKIE